MSAFLGSGPEGVDDLCFHTYGEFSPSSSSPSYPPPPASRPISQPGGPYPSLQAQIPVLRPKSHPKGPIPTPRPSFHSPGIWASRLGFGPGGWDMGLKAGIRASRLGEGGAEEEEKKEKKISHMCESIGHRPLWGRCPASLSTSTPTYLSRAQVLLTI